MGKIQMTPELIREEFAAKNKTLEENGDWLSPWDFYDLLFGDLEDRNVMIVEAKVKYKAMPLEEAIDYALGRDDIYISPGIYHEDYYDQEFLDYLHAIVVDVDYVRPGTLKALLSRVRSGEVPKPTVITNSGSGVHFFYIFKEPIYCYPRIRMALRSLYGAVHAAFDTGVGLCQKHHVGQAYRVVGGLTKVGDTTTAWRTGDLWTPEDLGEAVSYKWDPKPIDKTGPATEKMKEYAKSLAERAGVPEPDYKNYVDTFEFIREHRAIFQATKATRRNMQKSGIYTDKAPNGKPQWYYSTVPKVLARTQEGKRYSSLMALCVIAYKCRIPEEQLDRDLEEIATIWSEANHRWSDPFKVKNIPAAKRCYHQDWVKVKREQLEEWLGWEFNPQTKRRPKGKRLKQEAHLRRARTSRNALIAMDKKDAILDYLQDHPEASQREIARETGLSRNTVAKYYNEVKEQL